MKILKIFLSIVAILLSFVLVIAAVAPSNYALKREIVISKSNNDVFNYIKFLKNMDNYSAWAKLDPNMKKSYKGTDGTVGFITTWESKHEHVGKGEQEILNIIEGERIDTELRFYLPFEATDKAFLSTEKISDTETKVTWGFDGNMPYPMNLMLLVMDMEKELGVPLADGLKSLKEILEKE